MTLYEIREEILACFDEETGEVINEELFDALVLQENEKLENIALWIKDLEAEAEAIKEEAKNLTSRASAKTRKAENLREFLRGALGGSSFETSKVRVSYRKSDTLEVADDAEIPLEYLNIAPTVKKKELKSAIKDGLEVKGVSIKNNINMIIK